MSDRTDLQLADWRQRIDRRLEDMARQSWETAPALRDAIHYSLVGEGKRLRGLLVLAAYEAAGGQGDASGLAAAIEVVHAYSLVHDDLPCMDDDHMRRGRPTTHRAFDVATATVVGVAMVPLAVEQVLRASEELRLSDDVTRRIVAELMRASGGGGMVGGQLLDLEGERRRLSIQELEGVHGAKTGALIAAALLIGAVAAGASARVVAALDASGRALGLSFQIADDVLDATASSEALGKSAGKDLAQDKSTYASVLGLAVAGERRDALVDRAMADLDAAGLRTPMLDRLARFIAARRS